MSQYTTFYKMKLEDAHNFLNAWDKMSKRSEDNPFNSWVPENEDLYIRLLKEFPREELGYIQNNYELAKIVKRSAKVRSVNEPWFLADEVVMKDILQECVDVMITLGECHMPYTIKTIVDWTQDVWGGEYESFEPMPNYIFFIDTEL